MYKDLTIVQLEEVYELLTGHYVEDDDAQFRFNYSVSFLSWYDTLHRVVDASNS